MEKIGLDIVGLTYSQTQSGAYALVLGEKNGKRRLPVIIGGFEAQAIAIEIEKMTPSRPLTHDLFKAFSETFEVVVEEVLIYNLVDGIFFAKIICKNGEKSAEIDARTSDAIAIAVRFGCPIFAYDFILESAGIIIDGNDFAFLENMDSGASGSESSEKNDPLSYSSLSDEELKEKLNKALADEAYEKAAKIRDEIARRKAS